MTSFERFQLSISAAEPWQLEGKVISFLSCDASEKSIETPWKCDITPLWFKNVPNFIVQENRLVEYGNLKKRTNRKWRWRRRLSKICGNDQRANRQLTIQNSPQTSIWNLWTDFIWPAVPRQKRHHVTINENTKLRSQPPCPQREFGRIASFQENIRLIAEIRRLVKTFLQQSISEGLNSTPLCCTAGWLALSSLPLVISSRGSPPSPPPPWVEEPQMVEWITVCTPQSGSELKPLRMNRTRPSGAFNEPLHFISKCFLTGVCGNRLSAWLKQQIEVYPVPVIFWWSIQRLGVQITDSTEPQQSQKVN